MFIDKNKVSIIVISYNHEQFVEQCINSINSQSYKNIEIIIVDNNSTDSSAKILNQYSLQKNIKLIFLKENGGITGGINEGLKYVTGEFVTFFASDDVMVSNRIERQVSFLKLRTDAAGCFGNMLRINDDETLNSKGLLPLVSLQEFSLDDILFRRITLYSPTQLYRTDIILNEINSFPKNLKIEDIWLYHKLLNKGYKLFTIPYLLTFYRVHQNNTHTKFKMMMDEKIRILNEYKNESYYNKALSFIYLEHFSNFGSSSKIEALKLLPRVITKLNSKYLYLGLLRLIFDWR